MSKTDKPIEEFFLESLLKICLISIVIVMVVDYYFTRFALVQSLVVNSTVLFAILSTFFLYRKGLFYCCGVMDRFPHHGGNVLSKHCGGQYHYFVHGRGNGNRFWVLGIIKRKVPDLVTWHNACRYGFRVWLAGVASAGI